MLKKKLYFAAPVEVVRVTKNNMDEVAEWCGGSVHETESNKHPGRIDKYVWVPTPKGSRLSWAFPGMLVTRRMVQESDKNHVTWAVFRNDYFGRNYFENPETATEVIWGKNDPEVIETAKERKAKLETTFKPKSPGPAGPMPASVANVVINVLEPDLLQDPNLQRQIQFAKPNIMRNV